VGIYEEARLINLTAESASKSEARKFLNSRVKRKFFDLSMSGSLACIGQVAYETGEPTVA